MKIAAYTRISTDEKHQPYSLEAQKQRLAAYADSQEDWQIVRTFTDQKSGATLDRPQLQRALREAEAGRFHLLLVYRVDRLARSVRGLAQILERLDKAAVLFRSATEPFDTASPAGRMMVQMLGVFAEFERATIVERIIAGMERKAARGEWAAGNVPFGYRRGAEGFLEPNPQEAPIVRLIFERYAEHLHGAQTIARWLAERGHRNSRTGKPFNPKAVRTILRNRVYLGEVLFRGTYYQGPHEPLVDLALFDRAQQIITDRSDDNSLRRSNQSDYLLTGLLRCAHCGKRLVGAAANGNGGRYMYYVCFTRHRYGPRVCNADRLPAEQLDAAILDQVTAALAHESLVRDAIQDALDDIDAGQPKRDAEIAAIDAEIQRADETLNRYFTAFENGTMPEQACSQRITDLNAKLAGLRARRAELAIDDDEKLAPISEQDLRDLQASVHDVIGKGDAPARKALMQALVHEVRVISREEINATLALPVVRPPVPSVTVTGIRTPVSAVRGRLTIDEDAQESRIYGHRAGSPDG